MDLSLYGQSRDAEGRHRAAHPGLGPWVGARVASPRGPILRPGPLSVPRATSGEQFAPRRSGGSSARGAPPSTASLLQQGIDGQVLVHQPQAAPQGVGRLLRREPLEATVPHAVVLTEITVDRLEAVVGLPRHDVRLLPLGGALPANNPL